MAGSRSRSKIVSTWGSTLRVAPTWCSKVHVAEAVGSATDRDVARLEADLAKAGVVGATVGKTDPSRPQTIIVSGIPAAKLSDARSVLQGTDYSTYDVTTTADGNSALTMKVGAVRDLETRTLDTSIETIRERIDKLGVSEPVIQKYGLGENQILVELPGVDDPARVEEIIQFDRKAVDSCGDWRSLRVGSGCAAGKRWGDSS